MKWKKTKKQERRERKNKYDKRSTMGPLLYKMGINERTDRPTWRKTLFERCNNAFGVIQIKSVSLHSITRDLDRKLGL